MVGDGHWIWRITSRVFIPCVHWLRSHVRGIHDTNEELILLSLECVEEILLLLENILTLEEPNC